MTPRPIRFLSIEDVLRLHVIAIADQGGDPSIRDRGLLESALAMPQQQFGGEYLHPDIPAMGAAYAFHVCKNHPFVDGNKRAGFAAMAAFLTDNGWRFRTDIGAAEQAVLALAAGQTSKEDWTSWVRARCSERPRLELRDFFASIEPKKFFEAFDAVKPDSPGNAISECRATLDEVAFSMPAVRVLIELNNQAVADRDEKSRLTTAIAILAFAALYRMAEDMGYEW